MKPIFLIRTVAVKGGPNSTTPNGVMFIAVLSVKLKIKPYIQIHKMAMDYWDLMVNDLN